MLGNAGLNWKTGLDCETDRNRFYTETFQLNFQVELPFQHHPPLEIAAAESWGINFLNIVFTCEMLLIANLSPGATLSSL